MTGIGTVEPYNVVDVHTQVTRTIEKIGFVEGQAAEPEDLIAKLDPRPYQAALRRPKRRSRAIRRTSTTPKSISAGTRPF
jgi:multidrug efflux system membrane fusion protein